MASKRKRSAADVAAAVRTNVLESLANAEGFEIREDALLVEVNMRLPDTVSPAVLADALEYLRSQGYATKRVDELGTGTHWTITGDGADLWKARS